MLEERIKRAGKKPAAPATTAPPPTHPQQAKMPVEDKQHLKHPKQQLQRHSTPVEDEEVTASNGTKEEKTIPTIKYVVILYIQNLTNCASMYVCICDFTNLTCENQPCEHILHLINES